MLLNALDTACCSRRHRQISECGLDKLMEIAKEPYRTMVLLAGCLGLRISEVLGLRWQDFDWLRSEVKIERGVVEGYTDDVKTQSSRKRLPLDAAVISALQGWKLKTQFPADGDYVFASPFRWEESRCKGLKPRLTFSGLLLYGQDWDRSDGIHFVTATALGWMKQAPLCLYRKS